MGHFEISCDENESLMNFVFYTEIGSIMVESLSGELYLT
jgi:hypothetical protein